MMMKHRTTPDKITQLENGEVFVFGSNESGMHAGGAANIAHNRFGAQWGIGFGQTGQTFAIPTLDWGINKTLKPRDIGFYVKRFINHAKRRPSKTFLVTEIGCGIAGFKIEQIAPLFKRAIRVKNIHLPSRFWTILKRKKKRNDTRKRLQRS